ncbi:hypothetical protein EJB05_12348, partial [Eragrostis curvula]
MESLSLIDVSGEDDLFLGLASPPALPQPPDREPPRAGEFSEPSDSLFFAISDVEDGILGRRSAGFRVGAEAAADLRPAGGSPAAAGRAADPDGLTEDQVGPERTESPKQRKVKTGVNLRKSLAWDSAFFTSEGVLDTEELAIVNSTFRKTQGSRLPGITEESRRSGESTTSTLESESWAMESIETELFDNVRASIQRSLGKPSKVTGGPPASSKPPKATANATRVAARKAVDRMPQMKIRAPASTNHGVGSKQRPQVTSKEPTAARVTLPEAGEAKPSSKPPRALPRVATMRSSTNTSITSAISDKRSSTGGVVKKQAVGKSANTSAGVRPGGVMKSSSVSKSSGFTSAATKTDTNTKSAALNNTNRTAQRIPIRSSSRSDCSKTNPTRLSGNKIPARVHSGHASPSISPNSSIDSMSSVISGASTASTVGKTSHTSESLNAPSPALSPSLRNSNDHLLTTKLRPSNVTEGQSSGTSVSGDSLIATAGTTNLGKISKPTGLRRPMPNIGFFGAEKAIDQNSGAQMQVQSTKIQRLLPATPKSKLSSAQIMNTSSSSFGQQESKFSAPSEQSGASKSKAAKVLSSNVAQMEVVPFQVAKPEACTHQTASVVAEPEAEKTFVQTPSAQVQLQPLEIQCPLPATPNSQRSSTQTKIPASSPISQQESKATSVPDEIFASTREAVMVVSLEVAEMDIIASTSETVKVVEPESHSHETGPVVAEHEDEKSIDQNIGGQVQEQPMKIQLSLPGTTKSELPSTLDQQESRPTAAPHEESSALKGKIEQVPLNVAKAEPFEVSDLKVEETEAVKVVEHEVVTTTEASKENIPAQHQNIQANDDASALSVDLLIQKLSSVSMGPAKVVEHELLTTTEAIQANDDASALSVDLLIQKMSSVSMGPVKVAGHEVVTTTEASKENIPTLHQNIQANDGASALSVDLLIQKMSSVSLGSAPDMTS